LPPVSAIILVTIALLFSFLNGAKDGANALATMVTSRAMSPGWAMGIAALAEFCGPFVFGVAVARTIGAGVVDASAITIFVVIAALLAAGLWNVGMWWLSLPTSSSHAMIGGLVGAVVVNSHFNFAVLHRAGLTKIAIGLFISPVLGLAAAYALTRLFTLLLRNAPPRIELFFKRGQLLTTLGLALSFGANDAPKTMGLITLGLVSARVLPTFEVPLWAIVACAGTVTVGTVLGSRRVIRTIGTRFYRVRPFQAFNSQLTSALIVLLATLSGSPVSTSQVVSSTVVGAGAAERLTRVRWGVLGEIAWGWALTIPVTMLAGGLVYALLGAVVGH
jgi:inorganic phosphate transporter, PiT family